MKILLLANQPESTTRLHLFRNTLTYLGHQVIVPKFGTRNWFSIAVQSRGLIKKERPEVVHIFNVPDIIYRKIPELKGNYFQKLIYDYRSPWGIETEMNFGTPGRIFAEHFEKGLAKEADLITCVNSPLKEKVKSFLSDDHKKICVIPNYPEKRFLESTGSPGIPQYDVQKPVLFVGRVCTQEGIANFIQSARDMPDFDFWIVGDGPFSWWHLMNKPKNISFFGWQEHKKVAGFISQSALCLIPRNVNALTSYSNDKSIWKLNEYLNLGKIVIASGISVEEERKNLIVVSTEDLNETIKMYIRLSAVKFNEFELFCT